ncbi:hypothetical protein WJX79_005326 [Trebouxia sp. C0005]
MVKPEPKSGSMRMKKDGTPAKRMGRPPKSATKPDAPAQAAPKRRGRPPKSASKSNTDSASNAASAPKRRGRPAKAKPTPQQRHQQQQQQQVSEQAQSSQVHPQEALVLEVVGTSIQPAFVIQQHGVNSPDLTGAHEATDTPDSKPEGILSKLPSKKDVATAKKLAVKKTQAMKKTASMKAGDIAVAASDAADDMEQAVSSWGSAVWSTVTAPVSYISSGLRRLSGHVEC